jgi:hypothetical protein
VIRKILASVFIATLLFGGAQTIEDPQPAEAVGASAPVHGFHYNSWDVCEYSAAAHGFYPDFYVWQVHSFHYGDTHVYQCWLASWDGTTAVCGQLVSDVNGNWISGWDPYKYGPLAVVRCWVS